MNIVVVDDEPAIVKMCLKVLGDQGHAVEGFASASEALSYLASGRPADLLVVDYKMPEIDGFKLVEKAWALQPKLRVVMITAHGSQEVQRAAASTGVKEIVLKPFTASELAQSVQRATEGH